jgi:predicted permease
MILNAGTIRLVGRSLSRHRRVNGAIVVTLATLGAVVIALASLAYNLISAPWTYDSDRLGVLRHGIAGAAQQAYAFAPDEYRALNDSGLFESLSANQGQNVVFGDGTHAARPLLMMRTTPSALAVSDASVLLGRFITADDIGDTRQLVISYPVWQDVFDGRADALGKTMLLGGQPYTVIGVMPPRFHFGGGDLWSAHLVDPATDTTTQARYVLNFKLPPGQSIASIVPSLDALAARFPRAADRERYPNGWRLTGERVLDIVIGPQRQATQLVLVGALSLFLLGLLNVAALLIARQQAEAPALATRMALGESRATTIATVFVECITLAVIALAIACVAAQPLFTMLSGMVSTDWVPRELEGNFTFVTPALWSLPVAALVVAALLTLARVPGVLRVDGGASLTSTTRSGSSRGERRVLAGLSAVQITLATAVTIATLAIGAGAGALAARPLGYDANDAWHARLVFPADRYTAHGTRALAFDRLADTLTQRDGVSAVGFIDSPPTQRYPRGGVLTAPGILADGDALSIDYRAVHGDIVGALALKRVEGRAFETGRDRADSEPVVLISRTLAQRLAPTGSALGATVSVASGSNPAVPRRVVGVLDDVMHDSPLVPTRDTVYVPYVQEPAPASQLAGGQMSLVARQRAGLAWDQDAFADALASVDPWIARYDESSFTARVDRAIAGVTLARRLFAGFAVLGLLIATLGIAAVTSLAVRRRQHELAVRGAVGASSTSLVRLFIAGSLRTTLVATVLGAVLALLAIDLIGVALQGVAQLRVSDLLVAPTLMLLCALLATLWPASRAALVQPIALLRR